ncbi:CBS domain-containing protein [Streptomyces sp. NPDC032472]|uniref:CBS domain-containing protein n=1 Tax=Streptomyces sp. NPDC032472 TaxID=3155018 RepID=UPI0033E190FC
MKSLKVADLMTDEVVSVAPGTAFKDIVTLFAQYDISGVPVLDDEDRVVGVVSQSDVLAHAEPEPGAPQDEGAPARPATAGQIMSSPAVTVHAEETAADAARLMSRRGIERLPVVDEEDRLVGIVTRRDLLRMFLRPDSEIRRRVQDVLADLADVPAGDVDIHVVDGIVTLAGTVPRGSRLPVVLGLVERLDGVVAVASRITTRTDDAASTRAGHPRRAMPLRTVGDVMTHAVITVDRGTACEDVAETLRMWHLSSVPVLSEDGRVAGVVCESDLLLRPQEEAGTPRNALAGQLMTRPAVTVQKDTTIAGAARLMARGHLKRLPVVDDDGRPLGFVSRGDLLRAYLRPDADIAAELRELIAYQLLPHGSADVDVHVADGIVHLHGTLPDPTLQDVLLRAARTVPGVVDVEADFHGPRTRVGVTATNEPPDAGAPPAEAAQTGPVP